MSTRMLFEQWRGNAQQNQGWGLAWFLANEFCRRFYSSHGIAPYVIDHEGLGYYGIQLNQIACRIRNPNETPLGRLTMSGDVENWRSGGPGDHGLAAKEMCSKNIPTARIIMAAIQHMEIDPLPAQSHLGCRHQRWGASYSLAFEISTILALRYEEHGLEIWNHPEMTQYMMHKLDPLASMKEHPGIFVFIHGEKEVALAGDGRLLDGSERNLWIRYMQGESVISLADVLWDALT